MYWKTRGIHLSVYIDTTIQATPHHHPTSIPFVHLGAKSSAVSHGLGNKLDTPSHATIFLSPAYFPASCERSI